MQGKRSTDVQIIVTGRRKQKVKSHATEGLKSSEASVAGLWEEWKGGWSGS
jgi:hypothetical protein